MASMMTWEHADLDPVDDQALDSPASTSRAGQLHTEAPASHKVGQVQMEALDSPTSPSHRSEGTDEPPLQAASSPVLRAIPFMAPSHSPTHPHEISLDAWGAGHGGKEAVEGWDDDDDDWMNQ